MYLFLAAVFKAFSQAYAESCCILKTSYMLRLHPALHSFTPQGIKRLHIIAHSMGNYLLYRALYKECDAPVAKKLLADVATVSFAAPDVEREELDELLGYRMHLRSRAKPLRTTLYCSSQDLALMFSNVWRLGLRGCRAGLFTRAKEGHGYHPHLHIFLDTVDATGKHGRIHPGLTAAAAFKMAMKDSFCPLAAITLPQSYAFMPC
jgi:hypothetical protein